MTPSRTYSNWLARLSIGAAAAILYIGIANQMPLWELAAWENLWLASSYWQWRRARKIEER